MCSTICLGAWYSSAFSKTVNVIKLPTITFAPPKMNTFLCLLHNPPHLLALSHLEPWVIPRRNLLLFDNLIAGQGIVPGNTSVETAQRPIARRTFDNSQGSTDGLIAAHKLRMVVLVAVLRNRVNSHLLRGAAL